MPFNLDEQYIIKAETTLGIRFPESFRAKMMQENGGSIVIQSKSTSNLDDEFVYFLYPFFDTSDKKRASRTCNDIVRETLKVRHEYDFPSNLILIGDDGGSSWLVFMMKDDGTLDPAVYACPFDDNEFLYKLATDFSELKICNDNDE